MDTVMDTVCTSIETADHNVYLKLFRVNQCQLFLQHKCTQHRPYSCFNWHFPNQRRRRSTIINGSFNYSPYVYCPKYNETTGFCPNGDDCPLLHKTIGDVEKYYHINFYKTVICSYVTSTNGSCTRGGNHCPFAHGESDLRHPFLNPAIELSSELFPKSRAENEDSDMLNKLYGIHPHDVRWRSPFFVYAFYKTIPCEKPYSCGRGYLCPLFHGSNDKRRSPQTYTYKSPACTLVKNGETWNLPSDCHNGHDCAFCHTRTEQQFHIEVYKSSKCKDLLQRGYCPRGVFCAFSHSASEVRDVQHIKKTLTSGKKLVDIYNSRK